MLKARNSLELKAVINHEATEVTMICWKTLKRRFSRHKMLDQNTTSQLLKIKNVSLIQVAMVTHLPREIAGEKTMRVTIASRCLQSDHK